MINSRQEVKKYFFPVYAIWAVISPTLILIVNPISGYRIVSFYALFGLIWPLTFVVYPGFFLSFRANSDLFLPYAYSMFFIAWLGPVVHFGFAVYYHRKYLQSISNEEKKISFLDYLSGYLL